MANEYVLLSPEAARELRQLAQWARNFRATGACEFRNTPTGATLYVRGGGTAGPAPGRLLGATFRVKLAKSGGANGTKTTPATYTYVVRDLNDNVLGGTDATPVSPEWARPNGTMSEATMGLAYYATDGSVKVAVAFETPGTTDQCPS